MNPKPIIVTVTGEAPFRYMGSNGRFIVQASSNAYTLNYSQDGVSWTAWEDQTPANENLVVVHAVLGMFFKLVGNTGDVKVTY